MVTEQLHVDSLIIGYARELIAQHKERIKPLLLDHESLEGRLANTLETIIRYLREDDDG